MIKIADTEACLCLLRAMSLCKSVQCWKWDGMERYTSNSNSNKNSRSEEITSRA